MSNGKLSLDLGNNIIIKGTKFVVDGYIVLMHSNGTRWVEYKLRSEEQFTERWLSVDEFNNEYSIYREQAYSKEFSENNIRTRGYREVDSGSAKVVEYRGNVDVELGEEVFYEEYEDNAEEFLISIENWNNEREFSKGYYIEKKDIKKLDVQSSKKNDVCKSEEPGCLGYIITTVVIIGIGMLIFRFFNNLEDSTLSNFISSNSNFVYETSITSDLDKDKKADVYSTNSTIEEATKLIIDEIQESIEDVQENKKDDTVVITTVDQMALIYLSEDSEVLVQVSSRQYVYSSRNTIYRGSSITNWYYRNYYYRKWYSQDRKRYNNVTDGYMNYKAGTIKLDNNNKYKTYSDSIRQDSATSRTSSGDGVSSGK